MENKKIGIYMILNISNSKCYIGSSCRLYKRKSEHFYNLRKNKHHNIHLQNSFNKYGEGIFKFIILENNFEKKFLIEKEIKWVTKKDSLNRDKGYNIQIPDPECTHKSNQETIDKLILCNLKQDISLKDYKKEKEEKKRRIKENKLNLYIYEIDKTTGKIENKFQSIGRAATYHKYKNTKGISKVLNKETPSHKGYVYVYVNKYDENKDYRFLGKKLYKKDDNNKTIEVYQNTNDALSKNKDLTASGISTAMSRNSKYKGFFWKRNK